MKEQVKIPKTIQTGTLQIKFPTNISNEEIMKSVFESLVKHNYINVLTNSNNIKVGIKVWKIKENENK